MCIINFSPSRVKSKHHHQTKVQREKKKNYFSKIPLSNSSLLHSQNNKVEVIWLTLFGALPALECQASFD